MKLLISVFLFFLFGCATGRSGNFFKGAAKDNPSPNDSNMSIVDPLDIQTLSEQNHFPSFLLIVGAVFLIGLTPFIYSRTKPQWVKLWEKIKKRLDERKK